MRFSLGLAFLCIRISSDFENTSQLPTLTHCTTLSVIIVLLNQIDQSRLGWQASAELNVGKHAQISTCLETGVICHIAFMK